MFEAVLQQNRIITIISSKNINLSINERSNRENKTSK